MSRGENSLSPLSSRRKGISFGGPIAIPGFIIPKGEMWKMKKQERRGKEKEWKRKEKEGKREGRGTEKEKDIEKTERGRKGINVSHPEQGKEAERKGGKDEQRKRKGKEERKRR